MLYWKKLCGKVLIILKYKSSSFSSIFFSLLFNFKQFHEAFFWGKCALHSICTEIVIFYCIYLKQTGCFQIKKHKDHQIFQSNVAFVFISCSWLKVTWSVTEGYVLNLLPVWVMVLLFTPCPNSFCTTKESVAIFYCNIPFLVFSSTVLCCLILLPL